MMHDNRIFNPLLEESENWIREYEKQGSDSLFDWNKETVKEFKNVPVDVLLRDEYFLGLKDSVYKGVEDDILDLWNERKKREVNLALFLEAIGAGKCFVDNTLVFTPNGLKRINSWAGGRPKGFSPLKDDLIGEDGEASAASQYYITEEPLSTITITTQFGYEIKGSPDSKLRVYQDGEIVWKRFKEVNKEDIIPIRVNQQAFAKGYYEVDPELGPRIINEDIGYLLGVITGDGCIHENGVSITAHHEDSPILIRCMEIVRKEFFYQPNLDKEYRPGLWKLTIYNRMLLRWLEHIGLVGGSHDKNIPACILGSSKEVQASFLRGYFDADGSVRKTGKIELSAVNRQRIKDIQVMLANFGIISSTGWRSTKFKAEGEVVFEGEAWRIKISSLHAKKFFEDIGFGLERKQTRVKGLPDTFSQQVTGQIPIEYDWIISYLERYKPNAVDRSRLNRIKNNKIGFNRTFADQLEELPDYYHPDTYFFPVKDIQHSEEKQTLYDFEVPGTHCFQANGFVAHNSFKSSIIIWLLWYELSMHLNPQKHFGLANDSIMAIMLLSRSEVQTRRVVFNYIWDRFKCPFNKDYFPVDPNFTREIRINRNHTTVYPGTSSALSALGYNVYSSVIDEANFLEITEESKKSTNVEIYDAAQEMYHAVMNRMTSRFMKDGKLPGILVMISSPRFPDSFMERKIKEIKAIGPENVKAFYRSRALWEAKGPKYFPDFYKRDEYFVVNKETLEIVEEHGPRT